MPEGGNVSTTAQRILARTRELRKLYYVEFNRRTPWVAVHERNPRTANQVFFIKGKKAASLIAEADRISRTCGVVQNGAFLFIIDSAGSMYR